MTAGLREALNAICRRHDIVGLYVFGSRGEEITARVRGDGVTEPRADSDLDVGVVPASEADFGVIARVRLAQALEALFDVPRVDLVVLPEADPFLAANVIRGERLYARDEYAADEYNLHILRRAGDLASLERERIALILGEAP